MDITVLILVNLIIAVIMYFLFSLRFSVALEKAEKASRKNVIKELKQNIEQTIRLMDDSLDIIDQKMTTFYRLVRRAEELAEALEASSRKNQKKMTKIKDSKKQETSGEDLPFRSSVESEEKAEQDYMSRLLKNVKGEKLELSNSGQSAESIYRSGKLTSGPVRTEKGSQDQKGTVEKLGGMIRKILGVEGVSHNDHAADTVESGYIRMESAPPEESAFSGYLRESKKRVMAKPAPEETSDQAKKNSSAEDEFKKDYYEESNLTAGELLEKFRETNESPSRAEMVRYLLRHGCVPSEISRELGVSPAEVELIASLPVSKSNTRRSRVYNSDLEDEDD